MRIIKGFFVRYASKYFFLNSQALLLFNSVIQVIDEISPRSKDSIVGVGERLACKLVATILRDRVQILSFSGFFSSNNLLINRV